MASVSSGIFGQMIVTRPQMTPITPATITAVPRPWKYFSVESIAGSVLPARVTVPHPPGVMRVHPGMDQDGVGGQPALRVLEPQGLGRDCADPRRHPDPRRDVAVQRRDVRDLVRARCG